MDVRQCLQGNDFKDFTLKHSGLKLKVTHKCAKKFGMLSCHVTHQLLLASNNTPDTKRQLMGRLYNSKMSMQEDDIGIARFLIGS